MTDARVPIDELRAISASLAAVAARLDLLEAPTGTSAFRTVEKLTGLVADIQTELDTFMNGKYTNSQIDSKDAAVAAQIGPAISSTLAGNVTIGGHLFAQQAYGFDITYTRRAAWVGNDGRIAWASSSRTKKCSFRPAAIDTDAVLSIEPTDFYYRREIQRRTDLRINEGVDYTPKLETGLIAEDLVAAGLDAFVQFGEDGEPEGIEYQMLTVALLAVDKAQQAKLNALESRISALEAKSG